MKTRTMLRGIGPVVLAAGFCLSTAAIADNQLPTITVGAGVMTKADVGYSTSGVPLEQVTITHRVSYADLDLKTEAGARALKRRVKETARLACKQLDDLYPLEEKNAPECTRETIAKASLQVENAIAAARREAKAE